MPTKLRVASLALCFTLGAVYAQAAPQKPDSDQGVAPDIRVVTTGGLWEDGGRYGNCRIVVRAEGWEHIKSVILVQWLVSNESSKRVQVLKSLPLSELNDHDWVVVRAVTWDPGKSGCTFEITYSERIDEDKIRTGKLVLEKPGQYRFQQK